jgi:hypothetical protein
LDNFIGDEKFMEEQLQIMLQLERSKSQEEAAQG